MSFIRAELGASVFSHQDPEMMVKEIQETIVWIAVEYSKLKKEVWFMLLVSQIMIIVDEVGDFPCLRRI